MATFSVPKHQKLFFLKEVEILKRDRLLERKGLFSIVFHEQAERFKGKLMKLGIKEYSQGLRLPFVWGQNHQI